MTEWTGVAVNSALRGLDDQARPLRDGMEEMRDEFRGGRKREQRPHQLLAVLAQELK